MEKYNIVEYNCIECMPEQLYSTIMPVQLHPNVWNDAFESLNKIAFNDLRIKSGRTILMPKEEKKKVKKQEISPDDEKQYEALRLDHQLCFPLYAASREVVKQYTPYLKPLGLTYTQYITLMVLWEDRKLRVGDLGQKLFLDTGTLTPLLKKMEESGLVKRTRSSDDERVVLVEITDKGMAMRDKLKEVPGHVGQCLHLNKEDALILYQELYKVLRGFSE